MRERGERGEAARLTAGGPLPLKEQDDEKQSSLPPVNVNETGVMIKTVVSYNC